MSFKISCSTRILQRLRCPFSTHFPNAFLSLVDQQGSDSQSHPTRRLNHRSDSVHPPSCQRRQTAGGTRANCAALRDAVVKMTSFGSTASTNASDCVATNTCRSYDTRRIIATTRSTACGCNTVSGSSNHQQRWPPVFRKIQKRRQAKEPQRAIRRQARPNYLLTETVFPMQEHAAVFVFQNKVLKHSLNLSHDVTVQHIEGDRRRQETPTGFFRNQLIIVRDVSEFQ